MCSAIDRQAAAVMNRRTSATELLGLGWPSPERGDASEEVDEASDYISEDDLRDAFAHAYGIRISGLSDGGGVRYAHHKAGSFSIAQAELPGSLRLHVDPTTTVVMIRAVSGTLREMGADEDTLVTVGDWLLAASGLALRAGVEDAHVQIVTLNQAVLRRVASEHIATLPHEVQFLEPRTNSGTGTQYVDAAVEFASRVAADAQDNPMLSSAAVRALAAAVLASFANNVVTSGQHGDQGSQPAALRQATAFIVAKARSDIGIAEIAEHIHLTPRAVQYMFRRHLDTTPTDYLRHVRMDGAHRELVASDNSTASVAHIAQRWGFAHTGRFAVMYRETFGQSPHTTLRS